MYELSAVMYQKALGKMRIADLTTGFVPNMLRCQITRSTRLREMLELLNLTLTLTQEMNKHLHTRLCEIAHVQWRGSELFGTASYLRLYEDHRPLNQITSSMYINSSC